MVIKSLPKRCQRGSLTAELLVAMALLVGTLLPVSYAIQKERILARACYENAIAMEIIDGEMEILLSGAAAEFAPGTREYPVTAEAARNLSSGRFELTRSTNLLRLEWIPDEKQHGGRVLREVRVP
jgi:hypothetical protein